MPKNKKNDTAVSIQQLKDAINIFVKEREWDQFHSPKNLSMAIAIEAAELMEEFRFMSCAESVQKVAEDKENKEKVAHELADIVIATLSFCNLYDIDLSSSIEKKLAINAKKYPVQLSKGSNKKYHHYQKRTI
jgi:NTP pyrophosphatase (non-canonical NTP hydrolase)